MHAMLSMIKAVILKHSLVLSMLLLAGVLGTATTGLILANGSWDDVWGVAVALYLVGTVVWNVFSTGEQIFD